MDLSQFSRDVIAMSTAIVFIHNMFDAALYLNVCDKIVPRLLVRFLRASVAVFVPTKPLDTLTAFDIGIYQEPILAYYRSKASEERA